MIVRERIHHGNYLNDRTVEFDDDLLLRDVLSTLGRTSPYPFEFNPGENRYHAQALAEFAQFGRCDIGWATYRDGRHV